MHRTLVAFAIALIILSASAAGAQTCAGSGCLDDTFGLGGKSFSLIALANASNPKRAAIQTDGKILALTSIVFPYSGSGPTATIVRSNPDGSIDTTFGSGGYASMNWNTPGNGIGLPNDIAIQLVGGEERILVAGSGGDATTSLRVDRFLSNGSPDTSFGLGGSFLADLGYALSIAVQPDGKILTMGTSGALVRLNPNGTLDTGFGNGGSTQNNTWKIRSIAIQSDGRIVAVGYWTNVKGVLFMFAVRFNSNGSLDDGSRNDSTRNDTFGTKGSTMISDLPGSQAYDVKIDSSGRTVMVGLANGAYAAVRLTASGALDTSFGSGGKTLVDFSTPNDIAQSVEIQTDGKIVIVGNAWSSPTNRDTGLARLNTNGSLDPTFGAGGKVTTEFSNEGEFTSDGLLQIDPVCGCEKIVVVGIAKISGLTYSVTGRYIR